jgi:hypothetical protein
MGVCPPGKDLVLIPGKMGAKNRSDGQRAANGAFRNQIPFASAVWVKGYDISHEERDAST